MLKLASRIVLAALSAILISSPSLAAASKGRAVSLNALAAAMKSGDTSQPQHLCGITKVLGYLPDPKNHDIIIIGKVDPDLPELYLDDLVVAVRNTWLAYAKVQGHTRYYAAPGCSIDPDPNVLHELNDISRGQTNASDADAMRLLTEQWKAVGAKPQKVRVLGVPFDCRFAKVMVDADYYMKRLVNGSVSLGIDGFDSLTGMRTQLSKQQLMAGEDISTEQSLSRFWFSPGETTFEEKNGIVLLRDCSVCLLTEEEFLSEHNVVTGMGRPDPLAGKFAADFSAKYSKIASARPVYKELEALYRFAALARLMRDDRADLTAKTGFGYLLNAHKLQIVPVNRAVKGLADVQTITETVETAQGSRGYRLTQSFCGGVSMDVHPRRIKSAPRPAPVAAPTASATMPTTTPAPKSATTAKTTHSRPVRVASVPHKNAILGARKSARQVSWDIPLQGIE